MKIEDALRLVREYYKGPVDPRWASATKDEYEAVHMVLELVETLRDENQLLRALPENRDTVLAGRLTEAKRIASKNADAKYLLGELLARIHSDGGHYVEKHGWDKAAADADGVWAKLILAKDERDQLKEELAEEKQLFDDACIVCKPCSIAGGAEMNVKHLPPACPEPETGGTKDDAD